MEFTMIETGWLSLIPPILAITLALITKEVYSSLFIGLFSGMLIYAFASGGTIVSAVSMTFDMMCSKIADNAYMIIFLALLWAVVILVSKSGGSEAYGRWAGAKLKSRKSAALATSFLGILIFIDDGFNCLTVGTVMRPIMDRMRISREKLAYIIDSTAAPVCIIAPVSSWAVAVASEVSEEGGFGTFLQTIPYNFYALLTIAMVFLISITGKDFGPMKKAEEAAMKGDSLKGQQASADAEGKGKVIDLVLPILVLIICAILGMAYVGGFFSGVSFSEAIGYNPTAGLTLGAFAGLITAMLLYLPRKLMTAKEFIGYIVEGIGSPDPVVESWRCLPSAHRDRSLHFRFCEHCESAAGVSAGPDFHHLSAHELFDGHVLGYFRHADPDHHDDLRYTRRGSLSDPGARSYTGRIRLRRSLLTDLRYHDPVVHRRGVSAH